MSSTPFVHLGLHTEFSLKDSLVRVKPLIKELKNQGSYAACIADDANMFATIRFFKQCMSEGIKPIIASEVDVIMNNGNNSVFGKVTLICKDDTGYKNLIKIISKGYEEGLSGARKTPIISSRWLAEHSKGLIVLSGARKGPVGRLLLDNKGAEADEVIHFFKETFKNNFYLELQRCGHPDDHRCTELTAMKAIKHHLPVVATNDVRFMSRNDFKTHEIRAAIAERVTVDEYRNIYEHEYTPHQYLKTHEEMMDLFSDIPSAVINTGKIAERCSVQIMLGKNFLPAFPTGNSMSEDDFLRSSSEKGLEERLYFLFGHDKALLESKRSEYEARLQFELNVICNMGFPGYFLIVSEFIQWSKDNDIPVGPGRGSGAGSLVAYALKITDLDPLEYDLLFERFLNPDRVSMPDFDIDFCMDRREEVIQHTADVYGHKSVSQIITFGTMAARSVVRDVARALGLPYRVGSVIAQSIPDIPGTKLSETMESSLDLQMLCENDPEVKEVIEHALILEGLTRQTGKHAGGVIIAPGLLTDFTPTYSDAEGNGFVSQYDKNDVEEAGLVKFDFLGLRTLTIVNNAIKHINKNKLAAGEAPVDISRIPLDDASVFEMFQRGETTAVFQVESKGMKDLLKRLKPDCFEDLIALVALFRPGPLQSGMVDNFINRKHGREELAFPDATYQHESLRETLLPTYGIILYQEQVMQIARTLAGYTLGEADMLRRAMGKKKPEEMEKQRSIFAKGAENNGIDPILAMKIFDLVEKFAGYGFNKSHSAAYALISYQTGWLKKHYPAEFMAAVLSSDMDKTDKVVNFISECRSMGLSIEPPSVNKSTRDFIPLSSNSIVYGFGAIKGIGDSAIEKIISVRDNGGNYLNILDFCKRSNMDKRVLRNAILAGVFDDFGYNRSSLFENHEMIQSSAKKILVQESMPQNDLFGDNSFEEVVKINEVAEWAEAKRLSGERHTLGLYLTGHPINQYKDELSSVIDGTLSEITQPVVEDEREDSDSELDVKVTDWKEKTVTVAGVIMASEVKVGKRGHTAFLTLDDSSRQIDVMVFNKQYHDCQHILTEIESNPDKKGEPIIIKGRLSKDKRTGLHKIIAYEVKSIDLIREKSLSHVWLDLDARPLNAEIGKQIHDLIQEQSEGNCKIIGQYKGKERALGNKEIKYTDDFIYKLKGILGEDIVSIVYKSDKNNEKMLNNSEQKAEIKKEGEQTRAKRHLDIEKLFARARESLSL
jgi:DNA polymerase-3 subunit alpha